jgi:hydroxysqualene dehydroxylase
MKYDVAVLGGGLSGLAAAVELALHGVKIIVVEQSPELGGRCYSFTDPVTGDIVDNGQHILIGAYHETLRYLELIGTRRYLNQNKTSSLFFHHPEKGMCEFSTRRIPPTFGVPGGILSSPLLSSLDRLKMIPVGRELQLWNSSLESKLRTLTIEEWLINLNQSDNARKCFWYPIAVSVMNELPHRASALLFARAMKKAFFGADADSQFLIPTVGQSELYALPASQLLSDNDAEILRGVEVTALDIRDDRVTSISLKDGRFIEAEKVVSAIPYYSLERILPPDVLSIEPFNNLDKFESSPIVSINLWFDKQIMNELYIGVIGRRIQWLFNRKGIIAEQKSPGYSLSAIISAAYDVVEMGKDELVQMAVEDIAHIYPQAARAKLIHANVIKEKRATFSCTNGIEQYRPDTRTPLLNLFLAGDWTNIGLPGTIEGAILSGFKAAKSVLA